MTLPSDCFLFRSPCGVIHIRAHTSMSMCRGSFSARNVSPVYEPETATCLWCIADRHATLTWFTWGKHE